MRRAAFLTIAFMSTLTAHSAFAEIPGINASSSGSVIGDDVLYSVGGGNAVTMGTAGNMDSISIGGGWNSNLVCGNMSMNNTLQNQLNGATSGFQTIMGSMISNATSAVSSLPGLIIQRANPALYNLLTNGILQGRLDFDRSKGTCRAIADKMLDVAGGQMGWNKIAEGQAMSQAVKNGNTDAVSAVAQVEKQGGNDGITWLGGNKAGGSGQQPIKVVGDVTGQTDASPEAAHGYCPPSRICPYRSDFQREQVFRPLQPVTDELRSGGSHVQKTHRHDGRENDPSSLQAYHCQ
ncbi:hypothetical protein PSE10B_54620 [Pseudomonas amygdali pv. eriobotryae]|nr:hypothetical protein PSE10B_54620 [Pseudomonas amygdali pv. eriobotryae]